jgi:hypothetical protein
MKYILCLFLALAQVASAQDTVDTLFTPMPAAWDDAQVMGTTTLGNGDVVVYGYGQFLPEPAPLNGCIIRDGELLPLPWEIPPNTAAIVQNADGTIYTSGSLGVYKIIGNTYEQIVPSTSLLRALYLHDGVLYFGGTVATIDTLFGNIGSYSIATGEIASTLLPGDIRDIVSYTMPTGEEYLVALSSEKGSSIQILDFDLKKISLPNSTIESLGAYIGREMLIIDGKLYVTCWEYEGNNGYLCVYDGYKWELSPNIGGVSKLWTSPTGEIYITGSIHYDNRRMSVVRAHTTAEFEELEDDKTRSIKSSMFGVEIFLTWQDDRMYVVLPSGSWVEGYQFSGHHFFRLDDEVPSYVRPENIAVYPNPSSGECTVELPTRVLEYLEIYDMVGNLVYREAVYGRKFNLSLNLERGTYILKCGEYKGKIIIAH